VGQACQTDRAAMQDVEPCGDLRTLAEAAATAVCAIYSPKAGVSCYTEANEILKKVHAHPSSHQLALMLADGDNPPEVQHFGFQVLLAALRAKPSTIHAHERTESKAWLLGLFASDRWVCKFDGSSNGNAAMSASPTGSSDVRRVVASPPYVRNKCAEVVAELARLDWPEEWPELKPALIRAGSSAGAGSAALVLRVWSQLGDMLAEDAKDLTVQRRRDLTAALVEV